MQQAQCPLCSKVTQNLAFHCIRNHPLRLGLPLPLPSHHAFSEIASYQKRASPFPPLHRIPFRRGASPYYQRGTYAAPLPSSSTTQKAVDVLANDLRDSNNYMAWHSVAQCTTDLSCSPVGLSSDDLIEKQLEARQNFSTRSPPVPEIYAALIRGGLPHMVCIDFANIAAIFTVFESIDPGAEAFLKRAAFIVCFMEPRVHPMALEVPFAKNLLRANRLFVQSCHGAQEAGDLCMADVIARVMLLSAHTATFHIIGNDLRHAKGSLRLFGSETVYCYHCLSMIPMLWRNTLGELYAALDKDPPFATKTGRKKNETEKAWD